VNCFSEYEVYKNCWETLGKLPEKDPPPELRWEIYRTLKERLAGEEKRKVPFFPSVFLSILLGILFTMVGFFLISLKGDLEEFEFSHISLFAFFWFVAFSLLSFFLIRSFTKEGIRFSSISKVVIASFFSRVLLEYLCPLGLLLEIFSLEEITLSHCFLFGTLYSFLPVFVLTFFFVNWFLSRSFPTIVLFSIGFSILVFPFLYFTDEIVDQPWILLLSSVFGAFLGSGSGYFLKTKFSFS
jgi:hypothetical protein